MRKHAEKVLHMREAKLEYRVKYSTVLVIIANNNDNNT